MARHFSRGVLPVATVGLVLAAAVALAQYDTAWVRFYNGPANAGDDAFGICVDPLGNVYVTGPSVGAGTGQDYCTVKYRRDGSQVWVARFNGQANSTDVSQAVAVDSSGSVYVTGNSINVAGNNEIVIVKYDSSGARSWFAIFNGTGIGHDYGNQACVDRNGNIVVAGYCWNANYDYVVVKYRADGIPLWWASHNGSGSSSDFSYALAIDRSNCVIITGGSYGSTGGYNYLTVKYDQNGNLLWARQYNGTGNGTDIAYSVTTDSLNNVYVTGSSHGAAGADADMVTVAYDRDGNQLWVQRYNGDGNDADDGRCVRVAAAGDVFVCGSSMGFGTNSDMATVCYSSDGTLRWARRYDGSASGADYAYSLALDSAGNVYVAGVSNETGSGNQATLLRYNRDGEREWTAMFGRPGVGSDFLRQVSVDRSANVYGAGYSFGVAGSDMLTIKYLQPDAAAGPVLAPLGRLDTNAVIAPRAVVRNLGTAAQQIRAYCRISTIGGTTVYFDSTTVTLDAGASVPVDWDTWPGPHALYQYLVQCSVAVAFDGRPENDTSLGSFTIAAGAPGWREVRSVPALPSGRQVKDGGTTCFHAGSGLIYLLKGNKTGDFYSFHPLANSYTMLQPLPKGPSDRLVYKGAGIATDGGRYVYAVKGNNTEEFWRYDIAAGVWELRDSVPYGMSGKKVKGGGELLYVNGYCYLLKGYQNEFYRYDPVQDEWTALEAAPSPTVPKWDRGSFAVWDGGRFIYACKAKYNELWRYNIVTGSWETGQRASMPFYGSLGKVKRLKDGGCGAWYDGAIYALKGGNTQEFWQYVATQDRWNELDTMPSLGSTGRKKRVKAGADIVSTGYAFYALKGNNTLEMWRYVPQAMHDGQSIEGGGEDMSYGAQGVTGDARGAMCGRQSATFDLRDARRLVLFDIAGRRVLERVLSAGGIQRQEMVDLAGLAPGVYLARVESERAVVTQKVVVKR